MEKENWKDDILRSFEGARRAEPRPDLYARIRDQLGSHAPVAALQVVHRGYLALAAASLALLITANVWALSQHQRSAAPSSEYRLDNTRFDLYQPHGS